MEEKIEHTKEEWKAIKKEKKKKRRERELRKVIEKKRENPDTTLYEFQKFLVTNPKIALKEYKALGYVPTKAQINYMNKQERIRKEKVKKKRLARKKHREERAVREWYESYKDEVVERFLESGELWTVDEYHIIKDEFF